MNISSFIAKLPLENSSEFYIFHSKWEPEQIEINIIDYSKSENQEWHGEITIETLKSFAQDLEIPYEDFLDETKKALTTDGGLKNFVYSIKNDEFIWSKIDKFKMIYGSVPLFSMENLSKELLLKSINLINMLKDNLETSQLNAQRDNLEQKILMDSYQKCITEKDNMEKNLLTKFAVLLNSKKEKIAELQNILLQTTVTVSNDNPTKAKNGINEDETNSNREKHSTSEIYNSQQTPIILPKRQKIIQNSSSNKNSITSRAIPSSSSSAAQKNMHDDNSEDDDDMNIFNKM